MKNSLLVLLLILLGVLASQVVKADEFVPLEIKYQADRLLETQELEKFLEENTLDGYEDFDLTPFEGYDLDAICEESK